MVVGTSRMNGKAVAVLLALAVLPAEIRAEEKSGDKPAPPPTPAPPAETPIPLESADAAGLLAAMGKRVVVRGKVTRVHVWDGGITFINLAGGFTAVCFKKNLPNFPTPPDQLCARQTVEISGTLIAHQGKPQIELTQPEQIKVLPPAAVPPELPLPPAKPQPAPPTPSPAGSGPG